MEVSNEFITHQKPKAIRVMGRHPATLCVVNTRVVSCDLKLAKLSTVGWETGKKFQTLAAQQVKRWAPM